MEADRVGGACRLYAELTSSVGVKVVTGERLVSKWTEYERGLNAEFQWLEETGCRVAECFLLSHEISIANAKLDIQVVFILIFNILLYYVTMCSRYV